MRKLFLDDFRTVTMAQTYAHPREDNRGGVLRGLAGGIGEIVFSS